MIRNVAVDRLKAFCAAATERVASGYYAPYGEALPSNGSLRQALTDGSIIAELKPRSPSAGRLLVGDPRVVLDAFVDGGAAAVSVLADKDFFDGSPDLVRQAHVTGLPVLWKDFVVDAAQVQAAAHHGASAVLLIEALFDAPTDREALVDAAHDVGLEVLLEVHSSEEAERARASAADVLGINARDLRTLHEDLDGAIDTVRALRDDGRPIVALSSITTRQDVQRALAAGATGCLVGTALMQDPDPALRLRSLQRPLAKVCGVRDEAAVDAALDAGADLIGVVVLSPQSPRDTPIQEAAALLQQIRQGGARGVLVTDCNDSDAIRDAVANCRPDAVQLHGIIPDGVDGVRILYGAGPTQASASGDMVLDASKGRGKGLDLDAARRIVDTDPRRFLLIAGGLGPDNVADALKRTGATGADASSSLESAPGVKDPDRIRAFVEACHGA